MTNNITAAAIKTINGKQCAATEEVDDADAWNAICEFLDNLENPTWTEPVETEEYIRALNAWKAAWLDSANHCG